MKKFELRTGMIVTLRDNSRMTVFLGTDRLAINYITDGSQWINLDCYQGDLTHAKRSEFDIVAVASTQSPTDIFGRRTSTKIIWERPAKKMTVSEIEAILGYKIEIVGEE